MENRARHQMAAAQIAATDMGLIISAIVHLGR